MTRSERLLDLIQRLRTYRFAVTAGTLARDMGVSVRTIYRDIETLQSQGAPIEGEAGVGYILKPGFLLPPLMFSVEELEALVLGISWVSKRADVSLAYAAQNLVAKITSVLTAPLRQELEATTLLVAPNLKGPPVPDSVAAALRKAIRDEKKLQITYRDDKGNSTERIIWPFGLGYFENVLMVMAWCELRRDLRNFRADRIVEWQALPHTYPESRSSLLGRWKIKEGLTT